MESRFGHDFSQVRVHKDGLAAESAQAVNALAYTVGNHITFDVGQYRPYTQSGRQLMAHELVHVMQQSAHTRVAGQDLLIAGDDAAEHEAQRMGTAVEGALNDVPGEARYGPVLQRQPRVPAHLIIQPCERFGNCPPPPPSSPIPGCGAYLHQNVMLSLAREYVRTQLGSSLTLGVNSIDCFSGIGACTIEFDSGVAVRVSLLLNPFVTPGALGSGIVFIEEILPPSSPGSLKDLVHKRFGPQCSYDVGCPQPLGQLDWALRSCRQVDPFGPGDFPGPSGDERLA
jgi:hypothetical protein